MSLVDFNKHLSGMVALDLGPLIHGEVDCLLEPLSQAERRDVRSVLDLVTRKLAAASTSSRDMRIRLDAVIGALIGVADAIDGDCDVEDGNDCELVCEDEGAQCDDEGEPDDNGLADCAGHDEQMSVVRGLR